MKNICARDPLISFFGLIIDTIQDIPSSDMPCLDAPPRRYWQGILLQ